MMLKRFYNTGEPMEQTNVTYRIISNPTKSDIESLVDNPCIIHKAIMGDHATIGVIQPSDTLLWNLVGTPVDRDTFWNECLPQILTADVKPYYKCGTSMVSIVFLINELPEILKCCGAIWLNDDYRLVLLEDKPMLFSKYGEHRFNMSGTQEITLANFNKFQPVLQNSRQTIIDAYEDCLVQAYKVKNSVLTLKI